LKDIRGDDLNNNKEKIVLIRNSILLNFASIVEKTLAFIIIVLLARYLGKADFGRYVFAFSFVSLFLVFFEFGFNTLLIREIAKDRSFSIDYFSNAITIQLILSLIGSGIIVLSINLLGYPSTVIQAVYLVMLLVIFNSLSSSFRATFIAFERIEIDAILTILTKGIILIGIVLCIYYNANLLLIIFVSLIASIINLLLSAFLVSKKFFRFTIKINKDRINGIIKEAFPFALLTVFVMIYFQIDTVMLSKMKGDIAVGLYNASYKIVFVLMFLSTSIAMAVFPTISRLYISRKGMTEELYSRAFKYLFILAIFSSIVISILAERVIDIIYGKDFYDAAPILRIIIWVLPFMFLSNFMGRILGAIGHQGVVAWIAGVSAIINVVLNLILIPVYSYFGAAIATIITEAIVFSLQHYYMHRYKFMVPLFRFFMQMSLPGILIGIILFYIKDVNIVLALFFATVIFSITAYYMRLFSEADIYLFKDILLRRIGFSKGASPN